MSHTSRVVKPTFKFPDELDPIIVGVFRSVLNYIESTAHSLEEADFIRGRRIHAYKGRELQAVDVTVPIGGAAGQWGVGSTFTASGNDQRGQIDVVNAAAAGANPTVTITFRDGAWPTTPFALVVRNDALAAAPVTWVTTTTTLVITLNAAAAGVGTYKFAYFLLG